LAEDPEELPGLARFFWPARKSFQDRPFVGVERLSDDGAKQNHFRQLGPSSTVASGSLSSSAALRLTSFLTALPPFFHSFDFLFDLTGPESPLTAFVARPE
jgi:hypothetical protein